MSLKIYDAATDQFRAATQGDIDTAAAVARNSWRVRRLIRAITELHPVNDQRKIEELECALGRMTISPWA